MLEQNGLVASFGIVFPKLAALLADREKDDA
ncbi:MAG: hypothetical protein JWQ83_1142 [Lacunisphaera sp.]|nr:hypothetical protein [Lacunisphaera sp.]